LNEPAAVAAKNATVAGEPTTTAAEPALAARERDPRVRATHRRVLIAIAFLCVLLGAIGFAYARWLMTQPIPLKIPGH
jgi:hypothetical protein